MVKSMVCSLKKKVEKKINNFVPTGIYVPPSEKNSKQNKKPGSEAKFRAEL